MKHFPIKMVSELDSKTYQLKTEITYLNENGEFFVKSFFNQVPQEFQKNYIVDFVPGQLKDLRKVRRSASVSNAYISLYNPFNDSTDE